MIIQGDSLELKLDKIKESYKIEEPKLQLEISKLFPVRGYTIYRFIITDKNNVIVEATLHNNRIKKRFMLLTDEDAESFLTGAMASHESVVLVLQEDIKYLHEQIAFRESEINKLKDQVELLKKIDLNSNIGVKTKTEPPPPIKLPTAS